MATAQKSDFGTEDKPIPRDALSAIIRKQVIQSLGSPADMLKVQVNPVGTDRYRVNVMVGKSVGTARVADSFFLTADGEGNIITCSPEITRQY